MTVSTAHQTKWAAPEGAAFFMLFAQLLTCCFWLRRALSYLLYAQTCRSAQRRLGGSHGLA